MLFILQKTIAVDTYNLRESWYLEGQELCNHTIIIIGEAIHRQVILPHKGIIRSDLNFAECTWQVQWFEIPLSTPIRKRKCYH